MNQNELESIKRAADSTISLGEILAHAAIAVVNPAAGAIGVATILARHVSQAAFDRFKARGEEVVQKVVTVGDSEERERLLNGRIQIDDFYATFTAAVLDDEQNKLAYYATFLRNQLLDKVPSHQRLRLLKALKELTGEELELLRRGYISATQDMMTVGGTRQQLDDLLSPRSEEHAIMLESLHRCGLLRASGAKTYTPNSLAELAAQLYFTPEELTARSIGRKVWTGLNVVLASPWLDDTDLLFSLDRVLHQKSVKSQILSTHPSVVQRYPFTARTIFLVLDERGLPKDHGPALEKLPGKVIIKVLVPKPNGEVLTDPIPDVKSIATLQMLPGDLSEFAALVDEIVTIVTKPKTAGTPEPTVQVDRVR